MKEARSKRVYITRFNFYEVLELAKQSKVMEVRRGVPTRVLSWRKHEGTFWKCLCLHPGSGYAYAKYVKIQPKVHLRSVHFSVYK